MSCVRNVSSIIVVLLCTLGLAATALATPINYGNLNGDHIVYQQITEDSSTDPTPLFGAPSISADSLLFSPVSFGSNSGNGAFDMTDGTLTTSLVAINNSRIKKIQFSEAGDYTLGGNGTSSTSASVYNSLFVRITEIEGAAIDPIQVNANMAFSPSDGTYNLIDDRGAGVIWQGAVEIDLDAAISHAGRTGSATKAYVSLDNGLMTFSEPGTLAYIKKKTIDGVSITAITDVPEPATLILLGAGVIGLLVAGSRRRRAL